MKVTSQVTTLCMNHKEGGQYMVDVAELRGEMAKKNITGKRMAELLNIAPKTFYAKMKTGDFGCEDALIMSNALELSNPLGIFFVNE